MLPRSCPSFLGALGVRSPEWALAPSTVNRRLRWVMIDPLGDGVVPSDDSPGPFSSPSPARRRSTTAGRSPDDPAASPSGGLLWSPARTYVSAGTTRLLFPSHPSLMDWAPRRSFSRVVLGATLLCNSKSAVTLPQHCSTTVSSDMGIGLRRLSVLILIHWALCPACPLTPHSWRLTDAYISVMGRVYTAAWYLAPFLIGRMRADWAISRSSRLRFVWDR